MCTRTEAPDAPFWRSLHRAALVLGGVLLAGCSGRSALLAPPMVAAEARLAQPAAPLPAAMPVPPPHGPRLPPDPELVALPGGKAIPPRVGPGTAPVPPAATIASPHGIVQAAPQLAPASSGTAGCSIPPRAIQTQVAIAPPQVAREHGRSTLAAMGGRGPEAALHVAGLYRTSLGIGFALRIATAGNGCLIPAAMVRAEAPRSIFVASELTPGSCRYEVVLAHEREHARIDEVMLADLDSWIGAPLRRVLGEPEALRGDPQVLVRRLQSRFEEAQQAFNEARRRAQLSIDTPSEYARASRLCSS